MQSIEAFFMDRNTTIKTSKSPVKTTHGHNYQMGTLRLPLVLGPSDLIRLSKVAPKTNPLQKKSVSILCRRYLTSVYCIRSGAIKGYHLSVDGTEQVTGLYLPGEIFGLDRIVCNRYKNTAIAPKTTAICEIRFNQFEELCMTIPLPQKHFMQLMARKISSDQ